MNKAMTYPGLPAGDVLDPAWTKEKVRTRGSSSPSRAARRRASKRSPSVKGGAASTQADALRQNILEELFVTSRERFIRIAYRILRNREDAEDAVQDAFLSACRHVREFEGRSALTTWFTRIVMNAALMMRRKRKTAERWASHETDTATSSLTEIVPDTRPSPELAYSRAESFGILEVYLTKLNPRLRDAVVKTYYDELSVTEVSSALGVPPGTIKARLFRGRRLLQQRAASITAVHSHQTKDAEPALR